MIACHCVQLHAGSWDETPICRCACLNAIKLQQQVMAAGDGWVVLNNSNLTQKGQYKP